MENKLTAVSSEITVLVAASHPMFGYGLHQALRAEPDFQVVAEVCDGVAALAQLRRCRPALAVLDIELPQLDGFCVAATAKAEQLSSKVVLLSGQNQASFLKKALQLEVQGYLLKDSHLAEIVAGLRTVAQGLPYFSSAVLVHMMHSGSSARQVLTLTTDSSVEFTHLTPAERTVLKLLSECCTTKEIASQLLISPRTVETHRANICHKLGLRGNHALAKFALAHREQI